MMVVMDQGFGGNQSEYLVEQGGAEHRRSNAITIHGILVGAAGYGTSDFSPTQLVHGPTIGLVMLRRRWW